MAKWEVKRLFSQEFKRCNMEDKRNLWEIFLYSLLENGIISEKTFCKCWNVYN